MAAFMSVLSVQLNVIDVSLGRPGEEEKKRRGDKQTRRVQPHLPDDSVAFR